MDRGQLEDKNSQTCHWMSCSIPVSPLVLDGIENLSDVVCMIFFLVFCEFASLFERMRNLVSKSRRMCLQIDCSKIAAYWRFESSCFWFFFIYIQNLFLEWTLIWLMMHTLGVHISEDAVNQSMLFFFAKAWEELGMNIILHVLCVQYDCHTTGSIKSLVWGCCFFLPLLGCKTSIGVTH